MVLFSIFENSLYIYVCVCARGVCRQVRKDHGNSLHVRLTMPTATPFLCFLLADTRNINVYNSNG